MCDSCEPWTYTSQKENKKIKKKKGDGERVREKVGKVIYRGEIVAL